MYTDVEHFPPSPPASSQGSSIASSPSTPHTTLGDYIGGGNFASVFKIARDEEHVFKLFFQAPPQVLNAIQENIESFKTKYHDVATVIPTETPFLDNVSFPKEDKAGKPYSGRGYKMIKCDTSLRERLAPGIDISLHVKDALGKLTNTRFVHGDIKLDNIMLKHDGTKDIVHISDWDGVYMYDNTSLSGPPACVCFSPATAHPYYLWYVAMFKEKGLIKFEDLPERPTSIDTIWNMFLQDGNATAAMIKRIVNGLYDGSFDTHANVEHLKNPEWHKHMLERCDRYSLGMSLLLCAKSAGNTGMMSLGADIIFAACEIFSSQGGERRKSIRSGGEFLQARVASPLMDPVAKQPASAASPPAPAPPPSRSRLPMLLSSF